MKGPVKVGKKWLPPTTAAVPQDHDKIIEYTRNSLKQIYKKSP
jgi:hypothetical protein